MKVSKPADLLGLVPYLLGFRPSESLVLVLIKDGQVLLTARVDLPTLDLAADVVGELGRLSRQHGATGTVLLGYSTDLSRCRAVLEVAVRLLEPSGLLDAVAVTETHWWSVMCADRCCPSGGTPYDLGTDLKSAEAVYAGLTTASGRDAIEALVSGPPAGDHEALETISRDLLLDLEQVSLTERQQLVASTVAAFVQAPRRLRDAECAQLALLVADLEVRDVAWAAIDREVSEDHLDLWSQVVARTVAPWQPAPLCLLGMAAWISGNGALQNCCIDRARQADPHYRLVDLLDQLSRQAVPPNFWDLMGAEMRGVVGPLARGVGGR